MKKWGVLVGTGLASTIVTVDFTIVSTALPSFQATLSTSFSQLQWIIEAFGIPFCALLIVMGRLGDIYGHRRFLYAGMLGFALSSLGAGLSTEPWHLILARLFQGVFGATLLPCGMALTAAAFPKSEQGRALGIYGALLGIGLALGPVLGGLIISIASWPWIFYINLPIILLSFVICLFFVRKPHLVSKLTIDWKGLFLLIFGLGSLVYLFVEGPNLGWPLGLTAGLLAFSGACFVLFYRSEKKTKLPILPFHLLRNRGFLLGSLSLVASIGFVWTLFFLFPLYLQNVRGLSTETMGLVLFSMTLLTVLAPPFAGYLLDKKGRWPIILILFSTLTASYLLFLFFTETSPIWFIVLAFVLNGFAWGCGNGIGVPLCLSEIPSTLDAGVVSGSATTGFNILGVFFLAAVGTIFRFAEKVYLNTLSLSSEDHQAVETLFSKASSTLDSSISNQVLSAFKGSFLFGFQISMGIILILVIAIFIAVLTILRWKKSKI